MGLCRVYEDYHAPTFPSRAQLAEFARQTYWQRLGEPAIQREMEARIRRYFARAAHRRRRNRRRRLLQLVERKVMTGALGHPVGNVDGN